MRKIVLYIATSLDNFIAKPNGDTSWLHAPEYTIPGEDYGYGSFMENIDITLMGSKTYQVIKGFDIDFPYKDKTNYVFTRSEGLEPKDIDSVDFISNNIIGFVENLKREPGKDIWLIGGGQINTILFNHDLVDKMILTIIPITLGKGVPLFYGTMKETTFELESNKSYRNGLVQLTLNKKPN